VLTAVVRVYGVDPSWLIHGEYSSATHYAALEDDDVTPITMLPLGAPSTETGRSIPAALRTIT
jgi:hypothetical protein